MQKDTDKIYVNMLRTLADLVESGELEAPTAQKSVEKIPNGDGTFRGSEEAKLSIEFKDVSNLSKPLYKTLQELNKG
jgi:hypothetical protein